MIYAVLSCDANIRSWNWDVRSVFDNIYDAETAAKVIVDDPYSGERSVYVAEVVKFCGVSNVCAHDPRG